MMTDDALSLSEQVSELVQLAGIYLADGAPRTAADRLRKAATLLDDFADETDALYFGETP